MAVEFDDALVRPDEAGDHVEDRRLAGAVGTEQADRLAPPHRQADVLDDDRAAIAFAEIGDGQHAVPFGMGRRGTAFPAKPFALCGGVDALAEKIIAHRVSRAGSSGAPAASSI